jgi:hypothetical protein
MISIAILLHGQYLFVVVVPVIMWVTRKRSGSVIHIITGHAFKHRTRRPVGQRLVRSLVIVESGVRTPTGPKNDKFYMSCIRGSVVLFASTRCSRSRVAKFSAAVVTTMR